MLFVITLLCFLIGEGIGRFYGLCDFPLYIKSPTYEYIHAPNQSHTIYRNQFATNAWSMRSKPIDPQKDTTVVLLIGDSVINGGNLTDQDSLASTLLENSIIQFCEQEKIPLVQGMTLAVRADHYRDQIHYSERGQRFLAEVLYPVLNPILEDWAKIDYNKVKLLLKDAVKKLS